MNNYNIYLLSNFTLTIISHHYGDISHKSNKQIRYKVNNKEIFRKKITYKIVYTRSLKVIENTDKCRF